MKNTNTLNKLFLFGAIMLSSTSLFADDIWFTSPQAGASVQGMVQIQIQAPYGNPKSVNVVMEYDMGRETIVWKGKLTPQNNYTLTVDTTKFKAGKYNIEAEYYIQGEDYDGDIEVWVGTSTDDAKGEYFPQQ